jgi:hypothetical protein
MRSTFPDPSSSFPCAKHQPWPNGCRRFQSAVALPRRALCGVSGAAEPSRPVPADDKRQAEAGDFRQPTSLNGGTASCLV